MKSLVTLFFLLLICYAPSLYAEERGQEDGNNVFLSVREFRDHALSDPVGVPPDQFDTSGDGNIDYIVISDHDGNKRYEMLDYDRDGEMDDFCVYGGEGKLLRRAIDSNSDGMLDIWVFIKDGAYVEELRQDTDFDGVVDKVTKYGEEDQ
jgi:hypothetical protein